MSRFRAEVLKQRDSRLNEGLLWVGDKPYPALLESVRLSGPVYHQVRRAMIQSETRISLSIIWGCATWSTNRDARSAEFFVEEPTSVEVGILWDGQLLDDPLGYQTTDQVLALIRETQEGRWPSG
jgi:hypothetical protein